MTSQQGAEQATSDSLVLEPIAPIGNDEGKEQAEFKGPVACRQPTRASQQPYTVFEGWHFKLIVAFAIAMSWLTTISANVYFPALSSIANDLRTSEELISLTVTSYMIFQGLSPPLWSAISDVYGRRVAYMLCTVVYISACAGISQTEVYYQLLILRCLQSTGSASTLAIGSGVIGDITTRQNRGSIMGIYQGLSLVMNAAGPIMGGALAYSLGWRSIFIFLSAYAGVILLLLIFFLPETLRALVGNGSIAPVGIAMSPIAWWHLKRKKSKSDELGFDDAASTKEARKHIDFITPFKILIMRQTVFVLAFMTLGYTVWQMMIVALSNYFAIYYGLDELQIGLCFIANGIGSMAGSFTVGKVMDLEFVRQKKKHSGSSEDFPIEKARLRSVYIWSPLSWTSLILFGWTLDKRVHLAAPVIASLFVSMASVAVQSAVTTLLVDMFPKTSASAAAALNLCRCLVGAGGTAAVIPLCNAIGVGPTFSLLTGLEMLSVILIFIQIRNGPRWRERERARHAI